LRSGLLRLLEQLVLRYLFFGGLRPLQNEIHDLILEDRCAKLGERAPRLLVVLVDRLLLTREAARLLHERLAPLLLRDLELVLLGDLADDEAEAHAALRDLAVLLARLLLRLALVGEGLLGTLQVRLELLPDALELAVDQRRRQLERVGLLEL